MPNIEILVKRLYPNKIITHRISDLINHVSQQKDENFHINVCMEKENHSRQFCYLTLIELTILYQQSVAYERSLYELILATKRVKSYIDFEFYTSHNIDIQNSHIGPKCCLKTLHYFLNNEHNNHTNTTDYINMALQQFLVLESSTTEKISYHFIHANPPILFENNITLGLFIKVVIHYLLYSIIKHKCSSFNVNISLEKFTISDLIVQLTPYVTMLRERCTECRLFSSNITVAEIAHLLVLNSEDQFTLAIDLNVYCKNQQFRLFDCVKRGKQNALIQSSHFPFYKNNENSYYDILQKSIITNIQESNLPIVVLENHQFVSKSSNTVTASAVINYNLPNLYDINIHYKTFFIMSTNHTAVPDTNNSNRATNISYINIDPTEYHIQQFIPFVEKLIKSDSVHQGFIYSCVRGNRNTDILFFNIGGKYRFCPYKGTHHQRNTTAILIDIKNYTYCIRCKDADCNNKILNWNKIE